MAFNDVVLCKIHPGIGIARVGSCPSQFFVGPEVPGQPPLPLAGRKVAADPTRGVRARIKRQAARFRIFGYDTWGNVVHEITSAHARIAWTVRLANKKSAWYRLPRTPNDGCGRREPLRNRNVADRSLLVVDSRPQSVSPAVPSAVLRGLLGAAVPALDIKLGDLMVESSGQLLVLGGHGHSASWGGSPLVDYRNNDGWCDDTSDGPVEASVVFHDGRRLEVVPAWVLVAPPDFGRSDAPAANTAETTIGAQMTTGDGPDWLPAKRTKRLPIARPAASVWSAAFNITPTGLDQAALEAGAHSVLLSDHEFPLGMAQEFSGSLSRPTHCREPLRVDRRHRDPYAPGSPQVSAGDLTKCGAVPWQADVFECQQAQAALRVPMSEIGIWVI